MISETLVDRDSWQSSAPISRSENSIETHQYFVNQLTENFPSGYFLPFFGNFCPERQNFLFKIEIGT